MKSKIFIKSNYLKNNKDNWIYCDGELLCHKNVIFLHFKSENFEKTSLSSEFENKNICDFTSILRNYRSTLQNYRINFLCNISHVKSYSIKNIVVEGFDKLVLKLIPNGILNTKKLFLMPCDKASFADWLSLLTTYIDKANDASAINTFLKNNIANRLSSSFITSISNAISNSEEMYIPLDENDAYETNFENELHLVRVEPTSDSIKLNFSENYILKLGLDSLDLINISTREVMFAYPYTSIRRFGAKENTFRFEAGRYCPTGNGNFIFSVKDAVHIAEKLKTNAKQQKLNRIARNKSCLEFSKQPVGSLTSQKKLHTALNSDNFLTFPSISNNPFTETKRLSNSNNSNSVATPSQKTSNTQDFPNRNSINEIEPMITLTTFKAPQSTSKEKAVNNVERNIDNSRLLFAKEITTNETMLDRTPFQQNNPLLESPKIVKVDRTLSLLNTQRPFIFDISPQIKPRLKKIEEPLLKDAFVNNDYFNNPDDAEQNLSAFESNKSQISTTSTPNTNESSSTNYRVSDSTFFKYAKAPKPPTRTTPPRDFTSQTAQLTPFNTDSQNVGKSESCDSPKIPPPLLPKPKFKFGSDKPNQSNVKD